jgi:hypothetical protein
MTRFVIYNYLVRDAASVSEARYEAALAEAKRIVAQKKAEGRLASLTVELYRLLGPQGERGNDGLAERIAGARALYERPGTPGEKQAALAALKRMGVDPASFLQPTPKLFGIQVIYSDVSGQARVFMTGTYEAANPREAKDKAFRDAVRKWKASRQGDPPRFAIIIERTTQVK